MYSADLSLKLNGIVEMVSFLSTMQLYSPAIWTSTGSRNKAMAVNDMTVFTATQVLGFIQSITVEVRETTNDFGSKPLYSYVSVTVICENLPSRDKLNLLYP